MDLSPSDAETESSSSKELILLRRDVIELPLMLDIQFLFGVSWANWTLLEAAAVLGRDQKISSLLKGTAYRSPLGTVCWGCSLGIPEGLMKEARNLFDAARCWAVW
jgi:hypothetical protein